MCIKCGLNPCSCARFLLLFEDTMNSVLNQFQSTSRGGLDQCAFNSHRPKLNCERKMLMRPMRIQCAFDSVVCARVQRHLHVLVSSHKLMTSCLICSLHCIYVYVLYFPTEAHHYTNILRMINNNNNICMCVTLQLNMIQQC